MNFLIGLLPAFFWGLTPVLVNKLGGKPINQQLGTSFGCGILAVVLLLLRLYQPSYTVPFLVGCLISGLAWSVGQLCQYTSYVILGTSKAFALSISIEMVLNAIVGVAVFHEWTTGRQIIFGLTAIALVIIGGNLTVYESEKGSSDLKQGFLTLLLGACGFCVWNYALRVVEADGFSPLLPQSTGMILGSLVLSFLFGKDIKKFDATTFKQIIPGLIYAAANASLVISNQRNGVAIGYTMAQLCLVMETLFGIFILKEKKTPDELKHSIAGAAFITAGCIMVGFVASI